MQLLRAYGLPPVRGGLVDQPIGLLVVGMELLAYDAAFEEVRAADAAKPPRHPEGDALKLVMETTAAALLARR